MDTKKVTIGGILGGIVYFFLGWLIYGILLRGTLALPAEISAVIEYPPEEMKISFMIISCLALGLFLAVIFNRWAGISTFTGGMKGGAFIGLSISLIVGTSMLSMYRFGSVPNLIIDMVANAICMGIAGGVVGWFLGRE